MRRFLPNIMLSALVLCALAQAVPAQKKPKPALKEKDARRAIAAMPGFALNTGAVSVREISAAGTTPVTVAAEVTTAFRFEKAGEAKGQVELLAEKIAGATVAEMKWRAVEVRTGDRNWEELDFLVAPLGAEKVVRARAALEALVAEFEAEQRRAGKEIIEPITRGGLRIKQLSPMGSSVVAEVGVEATFNLARDAAGKWRVVEAAIAEASSGELASLVSSFNSQKAARALAEMETIKAALEAFRRERGFYVVAGDETVLMDHLSPRYIERIIRIDPWHRPYRYEGTGERFILSSDGPDGKAGTPDDVSPASINPTAGQRAVKGAR